MPPRSPCYHHTLISTLSHYHIPPHTRPTFSLPSSHSHIQTLTLSYSTPHPAHFLTAIMTLSYPHSYTIIFHPTPGPRSHCHHDTLISTLSHYHIPPHTRPAFSLPSSHSHFQTLTLTYSTPHPTTFLLPSSQSNMHTLTITYCTSHPAHIITAIITLSYLHSHTIVSHPTPGPNSYCHHHTLISKPSHYHIPPHTRLTFSLPSSHSHIKTLKLSYSTPHPAHFFTAIIILSYPHSHTIIVNPTPGQHSHCHHHTLISTL